MQWCYYRDEATSWRDAARRFSGLLDRSLETRCDDPGGWLVAIWAIQVAGAIERAN